MNDRTSDIIDATDLLTYARDMVQLIETCGHRPAASTAFVAVQKIEAALAKLDLVVKGTGV